MAEPTSSVVIAIATTAAGLSFFGVATGLQPALLLAGFSGGLWALSYLPPMYWWQRILVAVLGSLMAGWFAHPFALALTSFGWWPPIVTADLAKFPLAVVIGLLAHTVIGPALIRIARVKTDGVVK